MAPVDKAVGFLLERGQLKNGELLFVTGRVSFEIVLKAYTAKLPYIAAISGPSSMATASLGCLHAWFFHGCRWDEGWVGFGNRIHRAEFRKLGRRGPPLSLESREIRSRHSSRRVVIRYQFRFRQDDELVYASEQSAMFVRGS